MEILDEEVEGVEMISREKCLEWARKQGCTEPQPYDYGAQKDRFIIKYEDLEALINRAYQEGARDMRERAAKAYSAHDSAQEFLYAIKNLEIE